MLDIIFIILMFLNIILMIYAIDERRIAFCMMSSILWLILALFLVQGIEIPYEIYNSTASEIQTGIPSRIAPPTPLSPGVSPQYPSIRLPRTTIASSGLWVIFR